MDLLQALGKETGKVVETEKGPRTGSWEPMMLCCLLASGLLIARPPPHFGPGRLLRGHSDTLTVSEVNAGAAAAAAACKSRSCAEAGTA